MDAVYEILAEGGIYLFLFGYLAAAMLLEMFADSRRFSNWLGRFGALLIIMFIGLRWQTGSDWTPYFNIFYTSEISNDYDFVVFGIDYGYLIFNQIVHYFTTDYTVFLILDAAIAIGSVYYFIEKSTRWPNMGLFFFYSSYVVTHFMGSNRRMLAIGFVCIGLLQLMKRRPVADGWLRWTLPYALATTMHRTSMAALPALFVSRRAWRPIVVVLGLSLCVALGVAGLPFAALESLGGFLSRYTNITIVEKLIFYTSGAEAQATAEFDVMRQAMLGVAKRSSILALFTLYMVYGKPTEYAQRLYNIYVIGGAVYFLMIGSPVFQVISNYYSIVEVALLPIMFSDTSRWKIPAIFYLVPVSALLLISSLTPYLIYYVPYRSVFTTY